MEYTFKFLSCFLLIASVRAQNGPPSRVFQWKWTNEALGFELPSCQSLGITLMPYNVSIETHGTPPFYMLGHEVGGTSRITHIGDNETSLVWTVDHPVGTKLMLNVVDAQGSSGGIPPQLFTVVNGQTTSCIPSGNDTSFTVYSNITMDADLTTCAPWGIRIKGGAKPYNLTFAQLNSPIITNVTIRASDAFTYIQRATNDPGQMLLVSVSDVTGRWAYGNPVINPVGSKDVSCVGLVSSPGNATELDQEDQARKAAGNATGSADPAVTSGSHKNTAIIAGILVPVLVLLIGGTIAFCIYRRRLKIAQEKHLATTPEPFVDERRVLSINPLLHSNIPRTPTGHAGQGSISSSEPFDPYNTEQGSFLPASGTSLGSSGFSTLPPSSARPGKVSDTVMSRSTLSDVSTASGSQIQARSPIPQPMSQNATVLQASGGDYIIQHRDGGGVVRELPPPYIDRPLREQS